MSIQIKYDSPKSFYELQDFEKNECLVKNEVWLQVPLQHWENFEVSTYGRIRNLNTSKLRKSAIGARLTQIDYSVNSISIIDRKCQNGIKEKNKRISICDLMRYTFYPHIASTHVNPIVKDGNIFNLSLDNIKYVPSVYYEGEDIYKKEYIYINGEKTKYTIDTDGVIINQKTGRKLRPKYPNSNDNVIIRHHNKNVSATRIRWMSNVFLSNPHDLKFVERIDRSIIEPKLTNIYITNRHSDFKYKDFS